jgi:hypothetical protein
MKILCSGVTHGSCDWTFEHDEVPTIVLEELKHLEEKHPDFVAQYAPKREVWKIVKMITDVI